MTVHRIAGPDGTIHRFEAPDDATPEQVNGVAAQFVQSLEAAKPPTLTQRAASLASGALSKAEDTGDFAKKVIRGVGTGAVNAGRTMLNMYGSEASMLPESFKEQIRATEKRAGEYAKQEEQETGIPGLIGRVAPEFYGAAKLAGPVKASLEAGKKYLPKMLQQITGKTATAVPAAAGTVAGGSRVVPYLTAAGAEGPAAAFFDPDDPAFTGMTNAGIAAGGLRLARAVAHGAPRAPDVDILTSQDVPLTVGLAADKRTLMGRITKRIEEGVTKLPIVGDMIRMRHQEALDAARRAAVKRGDVPEAFMPRNTSAAGPIKPTPPPDTTGWSIDQLIAKQIEDYKNVYGNAVGNKTIRADPQGFKNIARITDNPDLALTDLERDPFREMVRRRLIDTLEHKGTAGKQPKSYKQIANMKPNQLPWWDAETLMKNQAGFRKVGYRWAQSADPAKRDMGFALRDIADEIYEVIGRQDVEAGKMLEALRAPYSAHKTVAAAAHRAPRIGEFSMPQLAKQAGRTGNEWLETFARQGSEHLPTTIATGDSSTSLLMSLLALSVAPKMVAGMAGAGAAYGTKTGQKVLQGQTKWQEGLADQLRKIGVD